MIRLIGYFFGIGIMLALLVAAGLAVYVGHLTKDLPDYEVLANYEPPVTTRVHAADGELMGEFARQRRSRPAVMMRFIASYTGAIRSNMPRTASGWSVPDSCVTGAVPTRTRPPAHCRRRRRSSRRRRSRAAR